MPLATRIVDPDGTVHTMPNGWGWWHVDCMAAVIRAEVPPPDGAADWSPTGWAMRSTLELLTLCPYTVQAEHTFTDPTDGEVLVITPGMVLDAWRE